MSETAPTPDRPLRLESIDVARGLAALSVAVYHYGLGPALAKATGWPTFELLSWPGSTVAVPVFFVISGFCIHLGSLSRRPGNETLRGFILLRFFRIYPPWLVAVLLSALVLWWGGRPPGAGQLALHLTLTNGFVDDYRFNVVLWSVSVEVMLYALYPFWLRFRRQRGLLPACLLAYAVSGASGLATAWLHPEPTGPALWFFLNVWCGWVAGAVLAELVQRRQDSARFGPTWWFAGAAAWVGLLLAKKSGVFTGALAFAHLPILITLCVWPVVALIRLEPWIEASSVVILRRGWSALAGIGTFSYSLYLLHVPLQTLRFGLNDRLSGTFAKSVLYLAWFGLILAASWLSYRWIEAPAARFGRRLAARPVASSPA